VSLTFRILAAAADRHAMAPTLNFCLEVKSPDRPPRSITLNTQIRIETRRRPYTAAEQEGLREVLGQPELWSRSLLFTQVHSTVPGFEGRTEVDLQVPCSYDLDVAASKYFDSLEDGQIPLLFLFNGTVYWRGSEGMEVEPLAWDQEARFVLPLSTWRSMMDRHFQGGGWIRLDRDHLQALRRYRSEHALTSWDEAVDRLLGVRV